jgi:putative ABC transport system substrate-binding protein
MAIRIRRREFIVTLGGAVATWPLAAHAQQASKLPTIGFLVAGTPTSHGQWIAAFVQRLRELGWIEGRTITIEYRWAEGRNERFAEIGGAGIATSTIPGRESLRPRLARSPL